MPAALAVLQDDRRLGKPVFRPESIQPAISFLQPYPDSVCVCPRQLHAPRKSMIGMASSKLPIANK